MKIFEIKKKELLQKNFYYQKYKNIVIMNNFNYLENN
jgi:hypothetical protein